VKRIRFFRNLSILFAFLLITLGINFFHSETNLNSNHACPACHFQNSTLTTAQVNVFFLPQLELFEILSSINIAQYNQIYYIQPSSRSPPLV